MTTDGTIVVTGGTGTLGRAVVARLRDAGREPRVLSRRAGPGRTVGDLDTGAGLDDAVRGASVVLHAATRPGHDVAATANLLRAVRRTGSHPHLIVVSIVGADRISLGYYRQKVAVEDLVTSSGLPWTIQRATQFHDLLDTIFCYTSWLPVLPVPADVRFQPVDVRDLAERLATLAAGKPAGRAPDLGGPEVLSMGELAGVWLAVRGRRRPVLRVRVPGAVVRGFRSGANLAAHRERGRITFVEFLGRAPGT
ncbi:SDR family oxidoreductase [Pseudonocardia sp. MH-G8]|uniref:SDR family oxidoreductase n=1 Tax=Pseudonocardia sp. MH-G8 TaxID=1854588 RepID=UPI000BA0A0D3|nr:NAD(P)H-binding protein [Pseudonocardia sp. MH-G8]OZM80122.1 NmrA family transcriptional regulator [Pseudonocardia sp. MH-G8]